MGRSDIGRFAAEERRASPAEPVIGVFPGVLFLDYFRDILFLPDRRDFCAFDRRRRDVDIQGDTRGKTADKHPNGRFQDEPGYLPIMEVAIPVGDGRNGHGRNLEKSALDGGRDRSRISDILLADIRTGVDAGDDDVGSARQQFFEGEVDAVGGRAVDGKDVNLDFLDAQRPAQGKRQGAGAFFPVGRGDENFAQVLQAVVENLDTFGKEAVVIR